MYFRKTLKNKYYTCALDAILRKFSVLSIYLFYVYTISLILIMEIIQMRGNFVKSMYIQNRLYLLQFRVSINDQVDLQVNHSRTEALQFAPA